MKKFFALLFIATSLLVASAQQAETQSVVEPKSELSSWDSASKYYSEADYSSAIAIYTKMLSDGERSWELYYNLGSAYYKDGDIGRAILNYERALRLDPSNEDVEHNLKVARAQTKDRIESLPNFFLFDALANLRDSIRPNSWVTLLIVILVITVVVFVLWFTRRRRAFLSLTVTLACLALISYGFAHSAYSRVEGSNEAIVLNTASVVRSSPNISGNELFVLHSGTKVEVESRNDNYTEVKIASGNKGWILSQDIEEI